MSRDGLGAYQPLSDEEESPGDALTSFEPVTELDSMQVTWDHIHNLDDFFQRIYYYHQHEGFFNIVLESVYSEVKLVVTWVLTTLALQCLKYEAIFTHKVQIQHWDDLIDLSQFFAFNFLNVMLWVVFSLTALFFTGPLLYRLKGQWLTRQFLREALRITDADMQDLTWNDMQTRLLSVQKGLRLCVHKPHLDQLDIHNRLLRHENYLIGMLNKGVLPVRVRLPLVGEVVFLSKGYLYNLHWLLYRAPQAPFQHPWQLRPAYKNTHERLELASELERGITVLAAINLLFMPIIFVMQVLFYVLENAERARSQPGHFFNRCWNNFSKLQLRHFNELRHALLARLHEARAPADKYVNCFVDRSTVTIARIVVFLTGSMVLFFGVLVLIHEPILHILGFGALLAGCGVIGRNALGLIPEEGVVFLPEVLLRETVKHIHYQPDGWCGTAHTSKTRRQFQELFVFRISIMMEELLSPFITPLWLFFVLRPKALEFVDFLRNFTVELPGVGDVCSFATFNVHRHGHPQYVMDPEIERDLNSNYHGKVEDGKLEMSIMNFHVSNPDWVPPAEGGALRYLQSMKQEMVNDLEHRRAPPAEMLVPNVAASFLQHPPLASFQASNFYRSMAPSFMGGGVGMSEFHQSSVIRLKGDVRSMVGTSRNVISTNATSGMPTGGPSNVASMMHSQADGPSYSFHGALTASMMAQSQMETSSSSFTGQSPSPVAGSQQQASFLTSQMWSPYQSSFLLHANRGGVSDTCLLLGHQEVVNADVSSSLMYIHELHQRKRRSQEFTRSACYQNVAQSLMRASTSGRAVLDPIMDAEEPPLQQQQMTFSSSLDDESDVRRSDEHDSARDHIV